MAVHEPITAAYRADVVGSLLRPPVLKEARQKLERGELDPAGFKRIEDRAVDEAIALQESIGLDAITDGVPRLRALVTSQGFDGALPDLRGDGLLV